MRYVFRNCSKAGNLLFSAADNKGVKTVAG